MTQLRCPSIIKTDDIFKPHNFREFYFLKRKKKLLSSKIQSRDETKRRERKREKERGREEGRKNELEEKLVKGLVVNTEVRLAKKIFLLFILHG